MQRAGHVERRAELRQLQVERRPVQPGAHPHRVDLDDAEVEAHADLDLEVGRVVAAHLHPEHAQDAVERRARRQRPGGDVERVPAARVEHRQRHVVEPRRRRARVPGGADADGLVARGDRMLRVDAHDGQVERERDLDVEQDAHLRAAVVDGRGAVGADDAVRDDQLGAAQDQLLRVHQVAGAERDRSERDQGAGGGRQLGRRRCQRRQHRQCAEHVERRRVGVRRVHLRQPVQVALGGPELGRDAPRVAILGDPQPGEEQADAVHRVAGPLPQRRLALRAGAPPRRPSRCRSRRTARRG